MVRRSARLTNAGEDEEDGGAEGPSFRERHRAVAEREASRLARPEVRPAAVLPHADRSRSAVSSTPSGVIASAASTTTVEEEWCGPFSVARRMIADRDEARRVRLEEEKEDMQHPLDVAMQELDSELKRKAHPAMQWKGSFGGSTGNTNGKTTNAYSKRQKRASASRQVVPTLFDLCVKYVVDNFEHVESLGCTMDADVRTAIANGLVSAQRLDGAAWAVIAEAGVEALPVSDCAGLTEEDVARRLAELLPTGLRYLVLDQCGRCFSHAAVAAIAGASHTNLFALSIGGAYSLQDADGAVLVQAMCPSSLEFKACNLLGPLTCASIRDAYATKALLELSLEDIPLTEGDLRALVAQPAAFRNLKSLSLRRIDGLNDGVVATMMELSAASLDSLELTENHQLTDGVLAAIRQHHPRRLRSLTLSGAKLLTAAGLEAFFTFVPGAPPPPVLQALDLSQCHGDAVTDDVLHLATLAATTQARAPAPAPAATSTSDPVVPPPPQPLPAAALLGSGMVRLNVQGSPRLTDAALEHVAATSARTLQELNVSFCPRLTDQGLGYLVDACGRQLRRVHVWGNAQLTDDFFDGHHRIADPALEMVGVWMKRNTSRTIR